MQGRTKEAAPKRPHQRGRTKEVNFPRQWRKILYEPQPYEDDYVDHTFLEELVKNANVRTRSFAYFSGNSVAVTQQVSAMVIFHAVFMEMVWGSLSYQVLLAINVLLLFLELLVRQNLDPQAPDLCSTLKARTILVLIMWVLSPVLLSLTKSYSDDTIWAQAVALSVLHLFCHDYYFVNFPENHPTINAPVSLNAALFASVLHASRLEDYQSVFSLMLFAIVLFAFFPISCHYLKQSSMTSHISMGVIMFVIAATLLSRLSVACYVIYTTLVALISFVCPAWLTIAQQHYKDEIHGPWDIAKIRR
jgi:phosphatidylinositol glycan class C protein